MKTLRLRAHAKLNLALRVGAVRDDGYHAIASVFQTISLCDLLYARRAEGRDSATLRLEVVGAELPADNTVAAAVERLAAEARQQGIEPRPLSMKLLKRVPLGAGLGGGSSDAVAAMAACVRLWGLDYGALVAGARLLQVAEALGSDVPFFLRGGTAMVTGRGERVEPLPPLPPTWFTVAAPDIEVSTPVAYAELDRLAGADPGALVDDPPPPAYRPRADGDWMGNDLQRPVSARYPEVDVVRRRLLQLGASAAQMTGSGAASFGTFADRRGAAGAARSLRTEGRWAGAFVSISGETHRRGLFDASLPPNPRGA